MPKINIVRKKLINASVAQVYQTLTSMSTWPIWSPWIIMDPDTKVEVAADDKSYSWNGHRTGQGHMSITAENTNEEIWYALTFVKPWKSKAKVKFTTTDTGEGTEVAWHMDSSLPWFMFWMKKKMTAFISNDYDRGLNLLKDYIEDEEVHSKLHHIGRQTYPGCTYVGIKRTCALWELGTSMQRDFERLMPMAHSSKNADPSGAFSQYHTFDFVKQIATYTAGVPYKEIPSDLPPDLITGTLAASTIYTLQHTGPYHHVGNAWSTMYTMYRNKEIAIKKDFHPFETYGNSPMDTPQNELISYINFAVK